MSPNNKNPDYLQEVNKEIYRRNSELAAVNKTLSLLRKLYQISLLALDPGSVSERISGTVRLDLNMEVVGVFLYNNKKDKLTPYKFSKSERLDISLKKAGIFFTDLEIKGVSNNLVLKQAMRDQESGIVHSLAEIWQDTGAQKKLSSVNADAKLKTILLFPLITQDKVIGLLMLGINRDYKLLSNYEKDSIESLIDVIAVALDRALLYEQLKGTNEELGRANIHLQELDKAKSEFVSIASHQLRTPMTGIMGYLSMMTQGDFGKMNPDHMEILKNLLAESQRMIRLINQFLNVSKIEAGKFTYTKIKTQLEDLIDREINELAKAAKDKGLKLIWKRPKQNLPAPMLDSDKLQDVILNLIDNAIKYTAKGSITITIEQEEESIHVRVKDTGIGIKPKDATELFNKFVRGSGIAQIHPDGSGLGLFIAKSIIDAHGGRIWAESAGEGEGSTFQFKVPITPPPETEVEPPSSGKQKVLRK